MQSIYVNDVTYGTDGENEPYKLYVLPTKVFSGNGFNFLTLHQRIASYEQISPPDVHSMNIVVEEDATYTSDLLTGSVPGGQSIVGVSWNPINDELEFDIRQLAISLHTLTPTLCFKIS